MKTRWVVMLVLGAVLPYIAVVMANAGRENAPSLPSTFVTAPPRPMIAPPRTNDGFAEPVPEDVAEDAAPGAQSKPHDRT